MKLTALAAALTAACAFALGYAWGAHEPAAPGSSADRTAYSFNWALNHSNTGKACSWVSQEFRTSRCPGVTDWRIASKTENPDGSVTYQIRSPSSPFEWHTIVVAQNADGVWRVQSLA